MYLCMDACIRHLVLPLLSGFQNGCLRLGFFCKYGTVVPVVALLLLLLLLFLLLLQLVVVVVVVVIVFIVAVRFR